MFFMKRPRAPGGLVDDEVWDRALTEMERCSIKRDAAETDLTPRRHVRPLSARCEPTLRYTVQMNVGRAS